LCLAPTFLPSGALHAWPAIPPFCRSCQFPGDPHSGRLVPECDGLDSRDAVGVGSESRSPGGRFHATVQTRIAGEGFRHNLVVTAPKHGRADPATLCFNPHEQTAGLSISTSPGRFPICWGCREPSSCRVFGGHPSRSHNLLDIQPSASQEGRSGGHPVPRRAAYGRKLVPSRLCSMSLPPPAATHTKIRSE
jgi:hypothetical protein